MAITITTQPIYYSPAFNPLKYKVFTDETDILYFDTRILNASGLTVSNLKIYPTPAVRTGATIDVQRIIQNHQQTTLVKNNNLVEYINNDFFQYTVRFTEMRLVSGATVSGATDSTYAVKSWNGKINPLQFGDYQVGDYLIADGHITNFLTRKPNYTSSYYSSTDYLYFHDSGSVTVKYDLTAYDSVGTVIYNSQTTLDPLKDRGRLNLSPRTLKSLGVDTAQLARIEAKLVGSTGNTLTDTVVRLYDNTCKDVVNVIWVNSLGGIDSYSFPTIGIEQLSNEKTVSKISTEDVYQTNEIVIDNNVSSSYNVTSEWLNNNAYKWLANELLNTRNAFIELSNGKLLPIQITNNSADVKNISKSTEMFFTLNFTAVSGLLEQLVTNNSDVTLPAGDYSMAIK